MPIFTIKNSTKRQKSSLVLHKLKFFNKFALYI